MVFYGDIDCLVSERVKIQPKTFKHKRVFVLRRRGAFAQRSLTTGQAGIFMSRAVILTAARLLRLNTLLRRIARRREFTQRYL